MAKVGKFKGSTMLEVVVAMTVVFVVITIAMMIISNLNKAVPSVQQIQAKAILEHRSLQTVPCENDDAELPAGWRMECKVKPYGGMQNLRSVELRLFDRNDKLLAVSNKILMLSGIERQK